MPTNSSMWFWIISQAAPSRYLCMCSRVHMRVCICVCKHTHVRVDASECVCALRVSNASKCACKSEYELYRRGMNIPCLRCIMKGTCLRRFGVAILKCIPDCLGTSKLVSENKNTCSVRFNHDVDEVRMVLRMVTYSLFFKSFVLMIRKFENALSNQPLTRVQALACNKLTRSGVRVKIWSNIVSHCCFHAQPRPHACGVGPSIALLFARRRV